MIVEVSGRMRRCTVCNKVFHFTVIPEHNECKEEVKKETKPKKK